MVATRRPGERRGVHAHHDDATRHALRGRRWCAELPTADLPETEVTDAAAAVDLHESLRRALLTLPVKQRAVLVLRYYEQLDEAEIAAALGCSPGTVKSRASRALTALREAGITRFDAEVSGA